MTIHTQYHTALLAIANDQQMQKMHDKEYPVYYDCTHEEALRAMLDNCPIRIKPTPSFRKYTCRLYYKVGLQHRYPTLWCAAYNEDQQSFESSPFFGDWIGTEFTVDVPE